MKRWFSGLLAAVMVLLLLPASASGEDPKYYVSLGGTASAEVNKPVSVALFMHQEPGDLTYNTFFFQFSYDAEKLTFTSVTIGNDSDVPDIINDNSNAGSLTIGGYGEPRSDRFITLNFNVKAAGEATVELVKAQMDVRANTAKDAQTASVPAGQSDTVTILCGGFPVELPKCATGDAYVTANGDYTFTADPGYDYSFSAAVDGKTVAIINNGDGSYTIENVTGNLVIKANSTPTVKTYAVTVEGDGSGERIMNPTTIIHLDEGAYIELGDEVTEIRVGTPENDRVIYRAGDEIPLCSAEEEEEIRAHIQRTARADGEIPWDGMAIRRAEEEKIS